MVEVAAKTPEQVAQSRLLELAQDLWNDAELGPKVQAKAKAKWPDAKTTNEVVDPWLNPLREENAKLAKALEEMREERAAEKKAAEQKTSEQSFAAMLDKVRREFSLTDEGVDKVVARMKEAGAYDVEAAAALVARQAPPAPVPGPTWAPKALDFWGSKNFDESNATLHRNPVDYMDAELSKFVKNPEQYTVNENQGLPT